jgi:branched-chain amino acid transport system permease protein
LIIIGGIGSIPGVIIGAVALIALPDILRQFKDYRLLLFGLLLVVMMIARPEGIIPSRRRKLELNPGEEPTTTPAEAKT